MTAELALSSPFKITTCDLEMWIAMPLVMLFCAGPIASTQESFSLDAVEQSKPVFIGAVLDVVDREDTFQDPLQNVSVLTMVDVPLKGELQPEQHVLFKHQHARLLLETEPSVAPALRHDSAKPKFIPWIGPLPVTFVKGKTYLFCLTQRAKDGVYELTFPQGESAVEISTVALAAVRQVTFTEHVKTNIIMILTAIKEDAKIGVAPLRTDHLEQ